MKNYIIGVTARIHDQDNNTFVRVNKNYLDQLTNRGLTPIILCPHNYQNVLPLCDGFLVIGGDDFNPTLYNEKNLGMSKDIRDYLDKLDQDVIKYAEENKLPLLGICRGIQAISAIHHEKLYQDINEAKLNHPENNKTHLVKRIALGNLSSKLPDEFLVNTYHHQAVQNLPSGYFATYVNGDIIEAVEHQTLPIIAFQWHPERLDTLETKIIFDYFVELVKKF